MEGQSERHGGGAPEGTGRALRPWPGTGDLGVAPGGSAFPRNSDTTSQRPTARSEFIKTRGSADGVAWVS